MNFYPVLWGLEWAAIRILIIRIPIPRISMWGKHRGDFIPTLIQVLQLGHSENPYSPSSGVRPEVCQMYWRDCAQVLVHVPVEEQAPWKASKPSSNKGEGLEKFGGWFSAIGAQSVRFSWICRKYTPSRKQNKQKEVISCTSPQNTQNSDNPVETRSTSWALYRWFL